MIEITPIMMRQSKGSRSAGVRSQRPALRWLSSLPMSQMTVSRKNIRLPRYRRDKMPELLSERATLGPATSKYNGSAASERTNSSTIRLMATAPTSPAMGSREGTPIRTASPIESRRYTVMVVVIAAGGNMMALSEEDKGSLDRYIALFISSLSNLLDYFWPCPVDDDG